MRTLGEVNPPTPSPILLVVRNELRRENTKGIDGQFAVVLTRERWAHMIRAGFRTNVWSILGNESHT
jgi:hypothetical protein